MKEKSLKLRKTTKNGVLAGWIEPCSILIDSIWARNSSVPCLQRFAGMEIIEISHYAKKSENGFGKNSHIQAIQFKILIFSPRSRMEICSDSPY